MSRKAKAVNIGDDLIASMQEALAHARGKKTDARVTRFEGAIKIVDENPEAVLRVLAKGSGQRPVRIRLNERPSSRAATRPFHSD
jgi:hypothetical protein